MAEVKERRAKIFRNGRSRAVRIPAEFQLDADEVYLRQSENGEIIISSLSRTEALLEHLRRVRRESPLWLEDDFPVIEDPLPEPFDIDDSDVK